MLKALADILAAGRNTHLLASMQRNAERCLDDARTCFNRGDFKSARSRARDSLLFSVGLTRADQILMVAEVA